MMLSKKPWLAAVAGVLAAALSLTACSGGAKPGAASGISLWGVSGGVREEAWKASVDEWNKANPNAQLKPEYIANDAYKERIRTALGAGTNPTIFFHWGGGTLAEYVKNNKVADITSGTEDVVKRVLPAVAQGGIVDGKVYAIPNGPTQPVLIYYNKDLFDKVGAKPPTTWDELMTVVGKFNAAGIAPFSLAGQSRWPYLMWIQYLTDRIGGPDVFQAVLDGKTDAWSDPAITSALQHIQDLVKAKGFGEGFASVSADADADIAQVYSGKAAMLMQGGWAYSSFKTGAADWVSAGKLGLTTFPVVSGGKGDPANIVGNPTTYWSVSANATEQQIADAKSYLNKMVFSDSYVSKLVAGGAVPPVAGIGDQFKTQADAEFLTKIYEMVQGAPHYQLSWDQALPPAQAEALLTNLDQIFLLKISPEQFVAAMNKTLG